MAFAFALIQVLDVVAGSYDWPRSAVHIVFGVLTLGFVVALVLAWYHGEEGRPGCVIVALVIAAAAAPEQAAGGRESGGADGPIAGTGELSKVGVA